MQNIMACPWAAITSVRRISFTSTEQVNQHMARDTHWLGRVSHYNILYLWLRASETEIIAARFASAAQNDFTWEDWFVTKLDCTKRSIIYRGLHAVGWQRLAAETTPPDEWRNTVSMRRRRDRKTSILICIASLSIFRKTIATTATFSATANSQSFQLL